MGNARRTVSVDADALATILDILEHAAYEQLRHALGWDA